ncbi:hypothetical protein CYLTODRAFT_395681 [Cylindrobasidium torrendii FP15055 ss-10]|uniref:DUF7143 domain-containing protein n=1 Tax=Cylindrobasidium torrendii FP15055 ss-10 TaxID=1314674 RepID=A0A0D7BDM1_9AGAR|nr:hypothetical protein CYLTODRAFT_395681 [Cylindrobasidium torrendii FP15055 ss-10]
MFNLSSIVFAATVFAASVGMAAPVRRQNNCYLTGKVALPAEIQNLQAGLSSVTCDTSNEVFPNVPDVTSGGISYSSIDFQSSNLSPLGFALKTFATPTDPAQTDMTVLQNQLNTYLAVESSIRSQSASNSANLTKVKSAKFFLQFQAARAKTALGQKLGVADTVEHQLGKVTKNAIGATKEELAAVNALAKQL